MITLDSRVARYGIPSKRERYPMFLSIAIATNGVALSLFIQQSTVQPTRTVLHAGVCLLGYLTPFASSLFIVLRHRTLPELIIAYLSLVCSMVWLLLAADVYWDKILKMPNYAMHTDSATMLRFQIDDRWRGGGDH